MSATRALGGRRKHAGHPVVPDQAAFQARQPGLRPAPGSRERAVFNRIQNPGQKRPLGPISLKELSRTAPAESSIRRVEPPAHRLLRRCGTSSLEAPRDPPVP